MSCKSAGKCDPDTNRYSCKVMEGECLFMLPDQKTCDEIFGPNVDVELDKRCY
jgi:hypothetical protein